MLGLGDGELEAYCATIDATVDASTGLMVLAACPENQPRLKHFEEGLRFDEVNLFILFLILFHKTKVKFIYYCRSFALLIP
jgi:hypothetical protein